MNIFLLLLLSVFVQNSFATSHDHILKKYQHRVPTSWGEKVPGVKTRLNTSEKVIALTLDACGSPTDGCDYRYINFLKKEKIPATIFVSNQWITRHPLDFKKLMHCPLFTIENHGLNHVPCSVNGKSIYKVQGTKNITELINEIEKNGEIIKKYTGRKPKFFRSGTAYYDEIATKIIHDLGYEAIGFDILGDAGTTWNSKKVEQALLASKPGSIIILHMNRPKKDCAVGAIKAIKQLQKKGFRFVALSQFPLM
jgi:peptidoglycan/xylan/chitin deacetylase (PgdA/CDA1 family)